MRIVVGVCSWGLGHATRTLPIIRKMVREGDDITVVSYGSSLNLLRNELNGNVQFVELQDYHPPSTQNPRMFAFDTLMSVPDYLFSMRREHRFVERLLDREKVDAIFSDNRWGFYSLRVPSFFMTHQLRIMNPLRLQSLERWTERFNQWFLRRLSGVMVPDFRENGLAGELAHGLRIIKEEDLNYIGVLSDFAHKTVKSDIDVFVSISGFEPQRTMFERLVLEELEGFEGNVVVSLGRPSEKMTKSANLMVQGLSSRETQEDLLNRARIVVARSGYSTMMDLCALGKRSLLIPTPGQTEQEYLASYHMNRGSYYCVRESELDLQAQLGEVMSREPPTPQHSVVEAVENAVGMITGTSGIA